MNIARFDLIIIGGGIAGLWTLAEARARGLQAILLEKNQLGGGQSLSSQGIIHGGSKYALGGKLTRATTTISDMPHIWQQALNGEHSVNLRDAVQLSTSQYLLPSSGIDTKLLSFFGSKTMSSHTQTVKAKALPDEYRAIGIHTNIFRLNEIVLDVQSVFCSLQQQFAEWIYQHSFSSRDLIASNNPDFPHQLTLNDQTIECRHLLLACGEGYENTGIDTQPMQKRPLQMVMAKGKQLPAVYAHFIGRSSKPLLTITSHPVADGTVWYMGGDLAENGVGKSASELIDEARRLLARLTPAVDTAQLSFATHNINRAEPKQSGLVRPDDAFVENNGRGILTGWPTKLALAPRFAEKVLAQIQPAKTRCDNTPLPLPKPGIADYPWSQL